MKKLMLMVFVIDGSPRVDLLQDGDHLRFRVPAPRHAYSPFFRRNHNQFRAESGEQVKMLRVRNSLFQRGPLGPARSCPPRRTAPVMRIANPKAVTSALVV